MNEQFKEQLNLIKILDILLARWTIVLLCAVLVGVFTFLYSEVLIAPVYSSSATLYVNSVKQQSSDDVTMTNITTSRQLVLTYSEILKTRTFLSVIADELGGKYSVGQLRGMISISSVNETEILSLTVKGTDADDVYRITKSVVKNAPDELIRVVEAGSVKILDNASETKTPISPNIRRNTFMGVLVGILLGVFIVVVLELFDTRIKDGETISGKYEEPLLGEIPSLMLPAGASSYGGNYGYGYGYGYGGYGYGDQKQNGGAK